MDMTADQIQPLQIFFPHAFERKTAVETQGTRFVHYTRADAAMRILKTNAVWMRKTSCMNDFTEVEHGLMCLSAAYRGESGDKFKAALNGIFDGISVENENLFNGWEPHLRADT